MLKKESRRKRLGWIVAVLAAVAVLFCVLSSVQEKQGIDLGIPKLSLPPVEVFSSLFEEYAGEIDSASAVPGDSGMEDAPLSVHFIDVGQAKAILIKAPEKSVLIDAGDNDKGQKVLRYLSAQGVDQLDIAVGTHPHADHIGGMDAVLLGISVDTVILPAIPDGITPTTKTYTDLLKAVSNLGLNITPASPGEEYDLGGGARLTVLGPLADYEDLNNMSVVLRLDYGKTSFLFTGDASDAAERDMLAASGSLRADVLDVGHHGSETATTEKFLQAVNPHIAVISCGLDNSYGHPTREVMQRLTERDIKILRTDFDGTAVILSNGESLGISVEK